MEVCEISCHLGLSEARIECKYFHIFYEFVFVFIYIYIYCCLMHIWANIGSNGYQNAFVIDGSGKAAFQLT